MHLEASDSKKVTISSFPLMVYYFNICLLVFFSVVLTDFIAQSINLNFYYGFSEPFLFLGRVWL